MWGLGSVGAERERWKEVVWLMFPGLELWGQPIEAGKLLSNLEVRLGVHIPLF